LNQNEPKGGAIMDMDKLKQWIDLSQSYQSDQFWKQVFAQKNGTGVSHPVEQPFAQGPSQRIVEWPACDMYLSQGNIYITVELAGIPLEDIQLSIQDDYIFINGMSKTVTEGVQYYVKERRHQKFQRKIRLPYLPDSQNPQTAFQNGLLIITFPINENEAPVKIDITQQQE
jgi:HSP20 family protein